MDIFIDFLNFVKAGLPAWIGLIAIPAALILFAVVLWLFGGKSAFWGTATVLGGAGFFIVALHADITVALCYLALFLVLSGLLRLLILLPSPFGRKKRGKREDRIYQKFYEPLKAEPAVQSSAKPPKVVCYEAPESAPVTAEERGMSLGYVSGLITRLKSEQLSPTDRLETEVIERTVEGYKNKELTEEELGVLNDCLATILKLTAKYKL